MRSVKRPSEQGYTIMELLIAAAVATTALYASLNMTTSVVQGHTELRAVTDAQLLAEHLVSSVQSQGMLWIDEVPYGAAEELKRVPATVGQISPWNIYSRTNPGFSKNKRVGRLGNDTLWDNGAQLMIIDGLAGWAESRFCAHYRVARVSTDLARVEVRVSWARQHSAVDSTIDCGIEMATDPDADKKYGSVTLAGTVMRNLHANQIVIPLF
ncbi:MAG TPA: hypothetical protein DCQ06_10685 [Myxococcales bacterium]|nr:hypothetical protein [Myxococcales bacterium]